MYNYLLGSKEQVGTSDPNPEPRQHYEVHCGKCGWWGYVSQLKKVYVAHPNCPDDVVLELGCPMCESDQYLEYEEQVNTYTTMYRLICFADTRDIKHLELEQVLRLHTSLADFTSALSYQLGVSMGEGLFNNYPGNFNTVIPKLAKELFKCLTSQSKKSEDE